MRAVPRWPDIPHAELFRTGKDVRAGQQTELAISDIVEPVRIAFDHAAIFPHFLKGLRRQYTHHPGMGFDAVSLEQLQVSDGVLEKNFSITASFTARPPCCLARQLPERASMTHEAAVL